MNYINTAENLILTEFQSQFTKVYDPLQKLDYDEEYQRMISMYNNSMNNLGSFEIAASSIFIFNNQLASNFKKAMQLYLSSNTCSLPEFKDFYVCNFQDNADTFKYGLLGNLASELTRANANFPELLIAKTLTTKDLQTLKFSSTSISQRLLQQQLKDKLTSVILKEILTNNTNVIKALQNYLILLFVMGGSFTTICLSLIQIWQNTQLKKNLINTKNFLIMIPFIKWQDRVVIALLKQIRSY